MLLNETQLSRKGQDRSAQRVASVDRLIAVFANSFSSVRYRIFASIGSVNAQASIAKGEQLVDLFGGLAFHPAIGQDALVFTLLHETGHHLSDGCRLPWAEIACECAADRWAVTAGRDALAAQGIDFRLEAALSQLECATRPCVATRRRRRPRSSCWSMDWHARKQALSARRPRRLNQCQIANFTQ
jgi:hypothetical protein